MTNYCSARKKIVGCLCALFAAILIVGGFNKASAEELTSVKVYVDTTRIQFAVVPMLEEGTTLVQLRPLFEALDIELEWDEAERTVKGAKDGMTFSVRIDSDEAALNGEPVGLARAARIIDGNTMVPLRFIGEATGALVHWDEEYGEIVIITEQWLEANGLTKEEAKRLLNEPVAAQSQLADGIAPALKGMYYSISLDIANMCGGGFCFQYYTFFPEGKVFGGEPKTGGAETIDCSNLPCSTYSIGDGVIVFDRTRPLSFGLTEDGRPVIDGKELIPVRPVTSDPKQSRLYETISTYGSTLGNAMTGGYILLQEDGSYKSGKLLMGTDFNYTLEQGGYASDSSELGTYEISGNAITFKHESGEQSSLFIMDISEDGSMSYAVIGGRLYKLHKQAFEQ